jgi:hypothetical protein
MKQYIELEKADDLLTEIVREIDDLRVRVGNPDDEHLLYNVLMKVFKVQDAISDSKVEEAIPASHPESPQPDKDAEINTLKAKLEYTQRKLENAWQELDKRDFETIKQLRSHPTDREVWVEQFKEKFCFRYPNGVDYTDVVIDYIKRYVLQDREQAEPVGWFEVKAIPEVAKVDGKINTCVYNELHNQHYLEIQHKFWAAINAIQKIVNQWKDREQPAPDREKGNDEASGSALI